MSALDPATLLELPEAVLADPLQAPDAVVHVLERHHQAPIGILPYPVRLHVLLGQVGVRLSRRGGRPHGIDLLCDPLGLLLAFPGRIVPLLRRLGGQLGTVLLSEAAPDKPAEPRRGWIERDGTTTIDHRVRRQPFGGR